MIVWTCLAYWHHHLWHKMGGGEARLKLNTLKVPTLLIGCNEHYIQPNSIFPRDLPFPLSLNFFLDVFSINNLTTPFILLSSKRIVMPFWNKDPWLIWIIHFFLFSNILSFFGKLSLEGSLSSISLFLSLLVVMDILSIPYHLVFFIILHSTFTSQIYSEPYHN